MFVIVHGGERGSSGGITPDVELTWDRLPLRAWCGYAGPRTSWIVTRSAEHGTFGFHDDTPLVITVSEALSGAGLNARRYGADASRRTRKPQARIIHAALRGLPSWCAGLGSRVTDRARLREVYLRDVYTIVKVNTLGGTRSAQRFKRNRRR